MIAHPGADYVTYARYFVQQQLQLAQLLQSLQQQSPLSEVTGRNAIKAIRSLANM
jgi:hypothetical protein